MGHTPQWPPGHAARDGNGSQPQLHPGWGGSSFSFWQPSVTKDLHTHNVKDACGVTEVQRVLREGAGLGMGAEPKAPNYSSL